MGAWRDLTQLQRTQLINSMIRFMKGGRIMMEKSKGVDRRHFMKMAALAAGGAALVGRAPFAGAQETAKEPESPSYPALNVEAVGRPR